MTTHLRRNFSPGLEDEEDEDPGTMHWHYSRTGVKNPPKRISTSPLSRAAMPRKQAETAVNETLQRAASARESGEIRFEQVQERLLASCLHCIHKSLLVDPCEEASWYASHDQNFTLLFDENSCHRTLGHLVDRKWQETLHNSSKNDVVVFILMVLERSQYSIQHCIMCMVYMLRIFKDAQSLSGLRIPVTMWRPLFITALVIADKVHSDSPARNKDVTNQVFSGMTASRLFQLELVFLKDLLKYNCQLYSDQFQTFCNDLLGVQEDKEIVRLMEHHEYIKKLRLFEAGGGDVYKETDKFKTIRQSAPICNLDRFGSRDKVAQERGMAQIEGRFQEGFSKQSSPRPNSLSTHKPQVYMGIGQTRLNACRDQGRIQSHSVGSLSTAASTPASGPRPANRASSACAPPSAYAPPATSKASSPAAVQGVRGKLTAVPSSQFVTSSGVTYPRSALASPERGVTEREAAYKRQDPRNMNRSPVRVVAGSVAATGQDRHAASAPNITTGQDLKQPSLQVSASTACTEVPKNSPQQMTPPMTSSQPPSSSVHAPSATSPTKAFQEPLGSLGASQKRAPLQPQRVGNVTSPVAGSPVAGSQSGGGAAPRVRSDPGVRQAVAARPSPTMNMKFNQPSARTPPSQTTPPMNRQFPPQTPKQENPVSLPPSSRSHSATAGHQSSIPSSLSRAVIPAQVTKAQPYQPARSTMPAVANRQLHQSPLGVSYASPPNDPGSPLGASTRTASDPSGRSPAGMITHRAAELPTRGRSTTPQYIEGASSTPATARRIA
mmetsp:Transcript_32483/g.51902  ORF Transcript_32483/g.51902 Transcript_32483/m.51902 type:complete len:780 (-) Transcript_32483:166-2505(-)